MSLRSLSALALVASSMCACASNGVLSSAGDFGAYRATRVEPTLELRLAAAQRYLAERPEGTFRAEVLAWFEGAEAVFYASKRGSRTGLHAYVDALPEGPHAEEARGRLTELDARGSDLERTAAEVTQKLSGPAATARAEARRELGAWLARWLDHASFELPLAEARRDLVVPFGLSLPRPRCEVLDPPENGAARRCAKLLELPFQVEGDHGLEMHQITLEIAVREDARGRPLEVTLSGPDLFLRLEETYRIRAIPPDADAERVAAVARGANLVRKAFQLHVSDAVACNRKADPPTVLRLACNGVQLELFPGLSPGADDLVTIVPVP